MLVLMTPGRRRQRRKRRRLGWPRLMNRLLLILAAVPAAGVMVKTQETLEAAQGQEADVMATIRETTGVVAVDPAEAATAAAVAVAAEAAEPVTVATEAEAEAVMAAEVEAARAAMAATVVGSPADG